MGEKPPGLPPPETIHGKVCGGLTPRQARFVEGVVEGKALGDAARDAGYAETTATVPSKIMNSPAVRAAFAELLPQPERIAQRINEGLDATKVEIVRHEGKVVAREELVDYVERRKYSELAARLHGFMPEARGADVRVGLGVQVHIGEQAPPQNEQELEIRIAVQIAELTNNFDPAVIARLKALGSGAAPTVIANSACPKHGSQSVLVESTS